MFTKVRLLSIMYGIISDSANMHWGRPGPSNLGPSTAQDNCAQFLYITFMYSTLMKAEGSNATGFSQCQWKSEEQFSLTERFVIISFPCKVT